MTVEVFGFLATQARASAATVVPSSSEEISMLSKQEVNQILHVLTFLSEMGELLDLTDLFVALWGLEFVNDHFQKLRVVSVATALGDPVVVL